MRKIIFTLLLSYTFIGFSQNTAIPDSNFEQALIDLGIDTNPTINGQVLTADIEGVTSLDIINKNISDLTGIEGFIALTILNCQNNQLSSIDVSTNPALTELRIFNNQLTSLDVSANPALIVLNFKSNQLTSIDVSANPALDYLNFKSNQLTSIDVSANPALDYLNFEFNQLTSLDVSANPALTRLFCSYNQLTSLNVSANPALIVLNFKSNELTSIDVSANPALDYLNFDFNQLTSLDVSANPALTRLFCSNNKLTSLNVRNGNNTDIIIFRANYNFALTCIIVDDASYSYANWTDIDSGAYFVENEAECILYTLIPDENFEQALIDLGIDTNPTPDGKVLTADIEGVTNLDVNNKNISGLTGIQDFIALTDLSCNNNQLTSLDFSANPALDYLNCNNNQLTSLDVTNNPALTELRINNNQLTSLDVSNNSALELLSCNNNQLTSVDVSSSNALTRLECRNNQLTILDVSNNSALEFLSCQNNQLTSLDVRNGNNENITTFNATTNLDLTCIFVDDVSYSDANWTDIDPASNLVADEAECDAIFTAIPDSNFEQALINLGIDIHPTPDGKVLTANIEVVTSLDIINKNISDLTGIEGFIALNILNCQNNQLTSLDVSNNLGLTELRIFNNQLTILDISNNSALELLSCQNNQLTSLDVSANPALIVFFCNENQLTSLDVSNNTALTRLRCFNNQLTSLDVRNGNNTNITTFNATTNPDLTCIYVDDIDYSTTNWTDIDPASTFLEDETECDALFTAIPDSNFEQALIEEGIDTNSTIDGQVLTANIEGVTNLDVSSKNIADLTGIEGFIALTDLDCNSNQLTGLDLSNNIALTNLDCGDNQLTSLDVNQNTALTDLSCRFNVLTSLDVSNNIALSTLTCDNNQLTSLNVINNTELIDLLCGANQLTSLDVSNNIALTRLFCISNQLTSLDVSANPALTILFCGINQLTSLDVSQNTALTQLSCIENQLTSLDVSNNTALELLFCSSNQLTSLDVSNNIALTELRIFNNQLTGSLNLSNNFLLGELQCQSNKIETINIRNGNNDNVTFFNALNNPDLYCMVVDDIDYSTTNWTNIDPAVTLVEDVALCENLSIVDNNFELEVTIYPNPTDNYLFIEGNVNPVSIIIYNLLGAKVIAKSNTDKIDVSELSKGVYIINISDGMSQTNKKFIKN